MRWAISLLMLTVLVVVWAPALTDSLTGKVVTVADGDSVTILDNTNTAPGFKVSTRPRKARTCGYGYSV